MNKKLFIGLGIFFIFFISFATAWTSTANMNKNLVGYFSFDNANLGVDYSPYGYSATDNAENQKATSCILGKCIWNDGTGSKFLESSFVGDMLSAVNKNYTICAWVNVSGYAGTTNKGIISLSNLGGDQGVLRASSATSSGKGELYSNSDNGNVYLTYENLNKMNNTWQFYCWRYNSSGTVADFALYVNGTIDDKWQGGELDNFYDISVKKLGIGTSMNSVSECLFGAMDEVSAWNESLNSQEMSWLFNNGIGCNPINDTPTGCFSGYMFNPEISTEITSPYNESGLIDWVLKEEQEVIYKINWSNSTLGTPIDYTTGQCNITVYNASFETYAPNSNFTTCSSGCDYANYTQGLSRNYRSVSNVLNDSVVFRGCHLSLAQGDIKVSAYCKEGGTATASWIVTPNMLPTCSVGMSRVQLDTTLLTSCNAINYTVSYNGTLLRGKMISRLEKYRHYSTYVDGTYYNQTTSLFTGLEEWVYLSHGSKSVYSQCNYTNGLYNNDSYKLDNITVVNAPPFIRFAEYFNISGIITNVTNSSIINYQGIGTWEIFFAVSDNDLVEYNITLYNKTSQIKTRSNSITPFTFNASDVRDFEGNPYNLTIWARDSNGDLTVRTRIFTVADPNFPGCTGFNNQTILNNSVYNFNVNCIDTSGLFSFNISCDNGLNHLQMGMYDESYYFGNSTLIVNDTNCIYEVCDGHTSTSIKDILITDENSKFKRTFDKNIEVSASVELADFKTTKLSDRYLFDITPVYQTSHLEFTVKSNKFIWIMPQDKYLGWVVTGDYWIDFESKDVKRSEVKRISENEVLIIQDYFTEIQKTSFQSIGKTNCISGSIDLRITSLADLFPKDFGELDIYSCPLDKSLSWVVAYGLILAFLVFILIWNSIYLKLPIFEVFCGLCFIVVAFPMYACSPILSIPFFLFGFGLILKGTFMQ